MPDPVFYHLSVVPSMGHNPGGAEKPIPGSVSNFCENLEETSPTRAMYTDIGQVNTAVVHSSFLAKMAVIGYGRQSGLSVDLSGYKAHRVKSATEWEPLGALGGGMIYRGVTNAGKVFYIGCQIDTSVPSVELNNG